MIAMQEFPDFPETLALHAIEPELVAALTF
jgi:hypothetical protein